MPLGLLDFRYTSLSNGQSDFRPRAHQFLLTAKYWTIYGRGLSTYRQVKTPYCQITLFFSKYALTCGNLGASPTPLKSIIQDVALVLAVLFSHTCARPIPLPTYRMVGTAH